MTAWFGPLLWSFLISVGFKSSVALGAAALGAWSLRRQSAAARHLVWTAGLVVLLILPLFSASLPALHVSMLPPLTSYGLTVQSAPFPHSEPSNVQSGSQSGPDSPATPSVRAPDWRIFLALVWVIGTALSFGQMLMAWVTLIRIRRKAKPLVLANFSVLARSLGITGRIDLLETERGSMPMTFGMLRPQIFLPADTLQWGEECRRLVILHEVAHVRRLDCVAHVVARLALCFYWWNPLAWIAWREFLNERERAADDLVLSMGARPSEYANHLLEIANRMYSPAALEWAGVAMARRSQLEGRLLAILESGRNRNAMRPTTAISALVMAIAVAVPLAALQSQSVSPSSREADPAVTAHSASTQRNPALLDRTAQAAEASGNYDLAQSLLQASVRLREQLWGRQAVEYGVGLLNLGDLEREQGQLDEARRLYTSAIPLLGNRPEAATALIHRGSTALIGKNKNVQAAIADFARAQNLNSGDAGVSDMWMAIAQDRQGNTGRADSSFQSALRKGDPNSANTATVLDLYAEFLRQQGRMSEAKSMRDQSAAIRTVLGGRPMPTVEDDSEIVYKIGGEISAPVLLSKVEPDYSQDARAAKYQGSVLLYAEVGVDGSAHNIRVSRGLGLGLNEKAIQAIRQWKFKPAGKDGQPVRVGVNIEVNFRLL